MIIITDEILKSVEEYKYNLQEFIAGRLDNFKSFSACMGIYKEGPKDTYMVRPRIPGGVAALEQLKSICKIAEKYAQGKIRFTTRQDIQLHSVKIDVLDRVLEELVLAGLTTKGAGGDSVRNVACSPLSGVAQDEVFDVTPYMQAVCNYMLIDPDNLHLPRKYKISFSNSREDTAHATISDLGFIAKIVDGKRGFEVYGGGGLGVGARAAIKLNDFIEDSDALYYAQAMKKVFAREGDRTNRQKARLRFVLQRLGEQEFIKVFEEELEKVKKEENLKLHIEQKVENKRSINAGDNENQWDGKYKNIIFPQSQPGLYSFYIHPQNGNMLTSDLERVIDFIEKLDYEISIRLTMTQGFFIRDLEYKDLMILFDITTHFSSIYNIDNSITCAGPTICNFGINNSQGMLTSIIKNFEGATSEVKDALPRIQVSGCYNSCGHHQKGLIGLSGKRKRNEDGTIPVYNVSFNGRVGENVTFGEVYGDLPAKKIPAFFLELANLKVNSGYNDFINFVENKKTEIKELVSKYSSIETMDENPDLYSDFE